MRRFWEFETEEVTIQTGQLLYSATIKLLTRPNVFSDNWSVYKSFTAKGRSAAEAQQNAMALAKAKEHDEDFYDGWDGTKALSEEKSVGKKKNSFLRK